MVKAVFSHNRPYVIRRLLTSSVRHQKEQPGKGLGPLKSSANEGVPWHIHRGMSKGSQARGREAKIAPKHTTREEDTPLQLGANAISLCSESVISISSLFEI